MSNLEVDLVQQRVVKLVQQRVIKTIARDFLLPESPRWHDGWLWMVDVVGGKVWRLSTDGRRELVVDARNKVAGLGFLRDSTPVVASQFDRKLNKIVNGALVPYADLSGFGVSPLNDLLVDPEDRVYVGEFGYDLYSGAEPSPAGLFLVEPDGAVRQVAANLSFANGIVLLDGGKKLVIAETFGHCLTSFDRSENGDLSGRRVHFALPGYTPDGICVDAEGGIWVSSCETGDFLRLDKTGEITDTIQIEGGKAFACALGGEDGRTLFCNVYEGPFEDLFAGKTKGYVGVVQVTVAAA